MSYDQPEVLDNPYREAKTMTDTKEKKKRGPKKTSLEQLEAERDKYEAQVKALQTKRDGLMESVRLIDMAMKGALAARDAFRQALRAQTESCAVDAVADTLPPSKAVRA